MASNNSVLNIVIRARDLAKGALTKVTARLRSMGRASQQSEHRFASLGRSIRNLVLTSVGFYATARDQGELSAYEHHHRGHLTGPHPHRAERVGNRAGYRQLQLEPHRPALGSQQPCPDRTRPKRPEAGRDKHQRLGVGIHY